MNTFINQPFFNYIFPFLRKLNSGVIIRKMFSVLFRILAFLVVIAIFGLSIYSIIKSVQLHIPVGPFFGLLFGMILLILFSFIAMQIFLYHAVEIESLPDSPFSVIPIFSIFVRTLGEILASLNIVVGIITFIVALFSRYGQYNLGIPGLFDAINIDFGLGIMGILIGSFIASFLILIISYLIAELYSVIVDIAINVRLILNNGNLQMSNEPTYIQHQKSTENANSFTNYKKFTIGREANCNIRFNDPTVSKLHAELIFENGVMIIKDLGSTNGTFVNDVKLSNSSKTLQPYDIVKVGNSMLPWKNYIS